LALVVKQMFVIICELLQVDQVITEFVLMLLIIRQL
jgi:hypothetical protein